MWLVGGSPNIGEGLRAFSLPLESEDRAPGSLFSLSRCGHGMRRMRSQSCQQTSNNGAKLLVTTHPVV